MEDNDERVAAFEDVVSALGADWELRVWRDAPSMLARCESFFDSVHLISLDHGLNPQPGARCDPGTGVHVARYLASHFPLCPVLIHSTNADCAWSMYNDLRFAGWKVDRAGPLGEDWVRRLWLPKAQEMLSQSMAANKFFPPGRSARRAYAAGIAFPGKFGHWRCRWRNARLPARRSAAHH